MSPPPIAPSSAPHAEPRLGPPGPAPQRAPAPPRPAIAKIVGAGAHGQRLSAEPRSAAEPVRVTLSAPERVIVGSVMSENSGPSRNVLRLVSLVVLVGLAAIGAASLFHNGLGFLGL